MCNRESQWSGTNSKKILVKEYSISTLTLIETCKARIPLGSVNSSAIGLPNDAIIIRTSIAVDVSMLSSFRILEAF